MQKQSLIRIEREKMTSAREFGLIAKDTDDDDISRFAESAGMFNSCLGMLRRPPTSQAFTYLSAQIDQASDPRGSSFTLDKGDMRGTKPAQQRAVNTNLTNATQLHGMNPVAASSASAASARSMVASSTTSFGNTSYNGGRNIVACGGNSGVTPPVVLHTQMNENSNSSSLSLSLTPSEIVNVRDAALERIMNTDDDGTDLLNDLNAVYTGLQEPLKKALADAVRIMTKKQVEPAQQLDPLIKIIKLQKTSEQMKG